MYLVLHTAYASLHWTGTSKCKGLIVAATTNRRWENHAASEVGIHAKSRKAGERGRTCDATPSQELSHFIVCLHTNRPNHGVY